MVLADHQNILSAGCLPVVGKQMSDGGFDYGGAGHPRFGAGSFQDGFKVESDRPDESDWKCGLASRQVCRKIGREEVTERVVQ